MFLPQKKTEVSMYSYLNEDVQNNVLVYLVRRKDRYFLEVSE
jgi:hypothetical protein